MPGTKHVEARALPKLPRALARKCTGAPLHAHAYAHTQHKHAHTAHVHSSARVLIAAAWIGGARGARARQNGGVLLRNSCVCACTHTSVCAPSSCRKQKHVLAHI